MPKIESGPWISGTNHISLPDFSTTPDLASPASSFYHGAIEPSNSTMNSPLGVPKIYPSKMHNKLAAIMSCQEPKWRHKSWLLPPGYFQKEVEKLNNLEVERLLREFYYGLSRPQRTILLNYIKDGDLSLEEVLQTVKTETSFFSESNTVYNAQCLSIYYTLEEKAFRKHINT